MKVVTARRVSRFTDVVIGVDPSSSKLALVATSPDGVEAFTKRLPVDKTIACREAFDFILSIIIRYKQFLDSGRHMFLVVEQPVLGRGGPGSTIPQALIGGAILAAGKEFPQVHVVRANNTTWKKEVVGNGRASKDQIADSIRQLWPRAYRMAVYQGRRGDKRIDYDLMDASAINMLGRRIAATRRKIAYKRELRSRG